MSRRSATRFAVIASLRLTASTRFAGTGVILEDTLHLNVDESGRGSGPLSSGPVRARHLRCPLSQPAGVGVRVVEIMTRLALPAIHQG